MSKIPHPTVDEWLTRLDEQGKSKLTVASYRRALRHFVRWSEQTYGQPFEPAAIIPRDVVDWKKHQQVVEKTAPATFNQRLAALSRYFKWAVSRDYARTDPTAEVTALPQKRRRPKSLDETAVRRLLRAVHRQGNRRDIALVELLLGTGLRVSEVLALRVDDISLGSRSGEVVVRHGKGGTQRRVPLAAPVRRALGDYLAAERLAGDDPLWTGERGPLRDRSGVRYILRKYARQAGLDESQISSHVCRHTFATRYLQHNPADLRGLAALLGHADLNTVMIYTEPSTAELAERIQRAV